MMDQSTYAFALRSWGVRSLICLVIVYGIARYNGGPNWIVAAGWTFVILSLLASLFTVYMKRKSTGDE